MIALCIGSSMAIADDSNTARYNTITGGLEMPLVGIFDDTRNGSVTLQNIELSSGGYLFEIVTGTENEPQSVIDGHTPYYDPAYGTLDIPGAFIDGDFIDYSFTLVNVLQSAGDYQFRYIPTTGTITDSGDGGGSSTSQCYTYYNGRDYVDICW